MLDFVEAFLPTTLNFQTTEEKQYGVEKTHKTWLLPNYLETIIPGGKNFSHEVSSGWLNCSSYFLPTFSFFGIVVKHYTV